MNSFVIAALFLLIAVYYDSEIWKGYIKGYYRILILLSVGLGFFHANAFDQILPGNISGDAAYVQEYTSSASFIMNNTGEDAISFGGFNENSEINLTGVDTRVKLFNTVGRDLYAKDEDVKIVNGRCKIVVNDAEIERELVFKFG